MEQEPLLPVATSDSDKSLKHARLLLGVGVGALLVGAAALTGASFYKPNNVAEPTELAYKKAASEVLIYKRTHPSKDSASDCNFFTATIGMSCSYKGTEALADSSGDYCAHRAQGQAGPISYHNIKDSFEPRGKAEEWISTFNDHHRSSFDVNGANQNWNQFMSLNTGLFTANLDTHISMWKKLGVKYKAHTYVNPIDSETMYVLMTYNPSTGNVMEIHGAESPEHSEEFTELPDSVCVEAVSAGHSLSNLQQSYATSLQIYDDYLSTLTAEELEAEMALDGSEERTHGANTAGFLYRAYHGYPYAMFIKVSHPSMDVVKNANWMAVNAQLDFELYGDASDSSCHVARATVKKFEDVGDATIMFVQMDGNKDQKVKEYISFVENVHKERMGIQRGYDRFIDSHIGLNYRGIKLDDIAPTLVQSNAGFHAFKDVYESDPFCSTAADAESCGSIWTTGTSGLSIEMHGFFSEDKKFFNGDFEPMYMDMCNSLTNEGDDQLN